MSEEVSLDLACANAIRALAMDAVQQANSGHPGAPMGMADMAERLWRHHLKHNPQNPDWVNRDRFVLSNGHGSMLIYSLLHLTGYDVSMDDLKAFRQLGSSTPGHPEYGDTPGVETTTGPLGQGLANAVGMALAEKVLAQTFNATDSSGHLHTVVDHHTYVFAGDGCLMEGISHEACSLAGTWQLGKLICLYDDNGISIDGEVKDWFTDDTPARFRAYGWQVIEAVDGHDSAAIETAIAAAKANESQPTLICCKTRIGFGSPNKEGTAASHGSPLGDDEIVATRQRLSWEPGPFEIPKAVYNAWDAKSEGAAREGAWNEAFAAYEAALPELAAEFKRRLAGQLPDSWDAFVKQALASAQAAATSKATRQSSGDFIAELSEQLPELIGGSADLSGSNSTIWAAAAPVTGAGNGGNYIYYGVREFAMTAIASGLALHGGLIPFTGTFLMFMEYARNAVRMSSLMGVGAIHVYTHDSIGQGEDGPTHQPIEQLTNLRTTPNLCVWRPCDAVEVR
ncbi:MAG: transketolase, partial [Gammaproteobacteria bacterium]